MKRKFVHRLFVFILTVLILCVSVGNAFISVNDISVTHAAGPLVLGYDVMYEICRYFGSVFYGYSCARELPEVNFHDDDMAKLGHDLLISMYGFDGIFYPLPDYDPSITDPEYVEAYTQAQLAYLWPQFYGGQSYVFGSEALKETAETDFRLIQGGRDVHNNDDDDDDNNDDDDNVIHFPQRVGDAVEGFMAFTAAGAAAIAKAISDQYQKWVNGDPDSILADFLANFNDTFSDYESIQNADLTYHISGYESYTSPDGTRIDVTYNGSSFSKIYAVLRSEHGCVLYKYVDDNAADQQVYQCGYIMYRNGVRTSSGSNYSVGFYTPLGTYGVNVPIFSSLDSALAALKSDDYSSALNYAKTYQVADWLQDDWSGKLIDPLTGLNALSNWYNIARHQGLNALGANPTKDDLLNYLRDYFAQLGTDRLPEVDPSLAPIKYPSYVEDVVIDPAANPSVYPAPGSNPGTSPGTGTDPGIGIDPTPGVVDVPIEDIVPTVNDSFFDIAGSLRYKFPFSIPWDIYHLFTILSDYGGSSTGIEAYSDGGGHSREPDNSDDGGGHSREPDNSDDGGGHSRGPGNVSAPYFELPIVIERYGIEEYIIIDLEPYSVLSKLSRSMFSILFGLYLINLTFKVVSMRKEE